MTHAFASYSIQFKWDGTNWTEEWSNVKQIEINHGRSGGIMSKPAVSTCEIVVANDDKRFSPAYTSSPLYGDLLPGKEIRVRAIVGRYANFAGSSYLQLGTDHTDFKLETHVSFGALVYRTSATAGQRIMAKADPGGNTCYQLKIDGSAGITAEVEVDGVVQSAADATATSTSTWYLAIATYDGETLTLYTKEMPDGDLTTNATTCQGDITDSTEKITLAADSAGGNKLTGRLAYAFVRSDWLSVREVKRMVNRGLAYHAVTSNLTGWWTFKDSDATDSSDNSHTLTATGSMTYPALTDLYDVNLFRGRVKELRMEWADRQAHIACESEEGAFQRFESAIALVTDTTGGLVDDALDDYSWSAANRIVQPGLLEVTVGGWAQQGGLDTCHKLAEAEHGLFFFDQAGWPVFQNRDYRRQFRSAQSQVTFDENTLVADAEYVLNDSDIYNDVRINFYPRRVEATAVLWESGFVPFYMANTEEQTWAVYFSSGGEWVEAVNALTPVANTDYTANAESGGGGADKTADLTVAWEAWAKGGWVTLTAGANLYVTKMQVRADPYDVWGKQMDRELDTTSIAAYGLRVFLLDNDFIQSLERNTEYEFPYALMLLERFKDPVAAVAPVIIEANRSAVQLRAGLLMGLSDRITITHTLTGLSAAEFFVEQVKHSIATGGAQPYHRVELDVDLWHAYGYWRIGTSEFDGETVVAY